MKAQYQINQVTDMTIREFMPNCYQAMVTVNNDHRVTATLNTVSSTTSGMFYLTDSVFIVDGSKIDNVKLSQFETLSKKVISDYIGQKV